MIKVRTICASNINDCKKLQELLNEGYTIIRADSAGGVDDDHNYIVYILEKK